MKSKNYPPTTPLPHKRTAFLEFTDEPFKECIKHLELYRILIKNCKKYEIVK